MLNYQRVTIYIYICMGDNYIYMYTVPYCKWYNEITIYVTTWLIAPYIWIAYTGTTIYIWVFIVG